MTTAQKNQPQFDIRELSQLKDVVLGVLFSLDADDDIWGDQAAMLDALADRIEEEEDRWFETQPMPMPDSLKLLLLSLVPLSVMTAIAAFRRSRASR